MSFKMILASAAAFAMAAGTPALAAKGQNQNRQAALADSDGDGGEKARKTCRTFPHSATRMKREKLCLTRAEWKKFEESQDEM